MNFGGAPDGAIAHSGDDISEEITFYQFFVKRFSTGSHTVFQQLQRDILDALVASAEFEGNALAGLVGSVGGVHCGVDGGHHVHVLSVIWGRQVF